VILDCPPALDLLTLNALVAADTLIVPMQAEYFALEGVSELISTLERVRAAYNPSLTIEGVLLTMYDDRTNLAQQVTETLREYFKERLFLTVISAQRAVGRGAQPWQARGSLRCALTRHSGLLRAGRRIHGAQSHRGPIQIRQRATPAARTGGRCSPLAKLLTAA